MKLFSSLKDKIKAEWNRLLQRLGLAQTRDEGPDTGSGPSTSTGAGEGASGDAAPVEGGWSSSASTAAVPGCTSPAPVVLDFRFGGFSGGKAVEDARVKIGSVKMTANGMTYRFTSGDLSAWGLERTEAGALACAFYYDDAAQKWIGGKFDWISTSRLSRSFENIRGGYNGWKPEPFFSAKRRAFCIVSKDGKNRTNLAEAGK